MCVCVWRDATQRKNANHFVATAISVFHDQIQTTDMSE